MNTTQLLFVKCERNIVEFTVTAKNDTFTVVIIILQTKL